MSVESAFPRRSVKRSPPMDIGIKVAIIFLSIFVVFGGIIAVIVGYGDWRRSKMERS